MKTEPIKQQTVVAQVMDEIRNLIASGAYKPGDKIPTEKELSERFGVGRSSIREAIKIFNYLGVLESRAALGTFVQERSSISSEALTWSLLLGDDELEDIIDLRGSIELWSLIRLLKALRQGDPSAVETVQELQDIIDAMDRDAAEHRRENLVDSDYRFHDTIIRSSGMPLFTSIYEMLRSFMEKEIRDSQDDYGDIGMIHSEHDAILRSIRSGEDIKALQEYTAHIDNIKNRLRNRRSTKD